jgi:hypothetical protein
MEELDLNIENYDLEDILNVFKFYFLKKHIKFYLKYFILGIVKKVVLINSNIRLKKIRNTNYF